MSRFSFSDCGFCIAFLTVGLSISLGGTVSADDWPHWRGPGRDDTSSETGLMQSWPEGGPELVWINQQAGLGYAGFSIVDGRLYTMGLEDNREFALCLDAPTGREIWRKNIGPSFENRWGDGPRSTPSFDGDRVYCMAASGTLACLASADGREIWKIQMQDFGGSIPTWGYAESPLVDRDRVVCTPGGPVGTMLAVDKLTGQKIWQSEAFTKVFEDGKKSQPAKAHYSSILPADWNNERHYIQLTPLAVVGVAANSGSTLWRSDWLGRVAVIPSPVFDEGKVYVTSGYNVGSKVVQINDDNSATDVWFSRDMQNHHGGVIKIGSYLYGSSSKSFICQDFRTGERKWSERKIKKGAVAYADGRLYHVQESDGKVLLIKVDENGPEITGSFVLSPQTKRRKPDGRIWVHPVIADGKLYLRDQEIVYCFNIEAPR